jgi:hypothetical protein
MKQYLELAIDQFYELQEDLLDLNRHCVGGESNESYEVDGVKFNIIVDGCWEKSDSFNYTVFDIDGIQIYKGFWC